MVLLKTVNVPRFSMPPAVKAELSEMVLLLMVSVPPLYMPPPWSDGMLPPVTVSWFIVTVVSAAISNGRTPTVSWPSTAKPSPSITRLTPLVALLMIVVLAVRSISWVTVMVYVPAVVLVL